MNPFSLGVRAYATYQVLTGLRNLRIEGQHNLPARGAALIAARHYHHALDGAALVHGLSRQPHVFVALDWAGSPAQRLAMETLCNLVEWPIALRLENIDRTGAFAAHEARRYLRNAAERTRSLLRRGEIVVVFPEGYPTIDPAGSRKAADDAFLPFRDGVVQLALGAARAAGHAVPIVPAGLAYRKISARRYDLTLRLGTPVFAGDGPRHAVVATLEEAVRTLSVA